MANIGIQPKPPKFPGFAKTPKRNRIITCKISNTTRWNPGDLGFFDPKYDNKFINTGFAIEHVGNNTYFQNVRLFIDELKKSIDFVRVNFWMNFLSTKKLKNSVSTSMNGRRY